MKEEAFLCPKMGQKWAIFGGLLPSTLSKILHFPPKKVIVYGKTKGTDHILVSPKVCLAQWMWSLKGRTTHAVTSMECPNICPFEVIKVLRKIGVTLGDCLFTRRKEFLKIFRIHPGTQLISNKTNSVRAQL